MKQNKRSKGSIGICLTKYQNILKIHFNMISVIEHRKKRIDYGNQMENRKVNPRKDNNSSLNGDKGVFEFSGKDYHLIIIIIIIIYF